MIPLPQPLFSAAQTRELDRIAIEQRGIPGGTLMGRAGRAACRCLRARWPRARRIAVVCGAGNNGGDGYVLAEAARAHGIHATVMALAAPKSGDAKAARESMEKSGLSVQTFAPGALAQAEVIVDALFGTGLEREVAGAWREAIEAVNRAGKPAVALDMPSGLHADSGRVLGVAVRADLTLTFIGLKLGMFTGAGREYCGEILFDDLGVPGDIYGLVEPLARRSTPEDLAGLLTVRRRDAHKGDAGHVLVVGGELGMPGAPCMAGEAAYRAGAGLVTIATRHRHAAHISAARPELITYGAETTAEIRGLLGRATVLAVGPGLGRGDWGLGVWAAVLESDLPMVVDADGLNRLARDPVKRGRWVLTPHPGEAARLLGCSGEDIQRDRLGAATEIRARFGGVCVLKGSGTLIAGPRDRVRLCDRGNPGMASGGMGDVLTGVIAALMAQGLAPQGAAELGVWVHARAGDRAAAGGEIGLMATDLPPLVRAELNMLLKYRHEVPGIDGPR